MKKNWRTAALLVLVCLMTSSAWGLDFWDKLPADVLAQRLAAAMDDEELASQVFLWGYPGVVPPESFVHSIAQVGLGGVKIFGWNAVSTKAVAEAVRTFQKAAQESPFHIPLLVATDQEGGWVRHIKGRTSQTSGNLSLGAENLGWDSYKTGFYLGQELAILGVNMDFAPSVDLYIDPEVNVIGPRSFGRFPYQVGWLGVAFVRGEMDSGVIPTAKHFPGHGNTSQDSHGSLPIIHDDWNVLKSREMIPYKMLIQEGLPAIMTGHLAFPEISGNLLPASLNPKLNRDLLRDKLHFQGVVVTDDLFMVGAKPKEWSITEPALRGLEAGNDLLLISQPADVQAADRRAVVRKMETDRAFRDLVRAAVVRVLELKLKFLKGPKAVPLFPDPDHLALPDGQAQKFFFGQAVRSTVLIKGNDLPWPPQAGKG
ncbi:MAG: glycoside hydrolase family 3 protein, partial [Spirochaetales bacterium]|nr:glycoside hydrolase family 3 protein [Spirochaetales bacterium]